MRSVAGGIDGLEVVFDDGSLVGDGGLLLAGTVMHNRGWVWRRRTQTHTNTVRLDGRVAGSGAGRKVLSLVASMLVGGCCIDAAAAVGLGGGGAAFRGGGTVDCWVVFEVVHVRACAPARQSGRVGACAGVVC